MQFIVFCTIYNTLKLSQMNEEERYLKHIYKQYIYFIFYIIIFLVK